MSRPRLLPPDEVAERLKALPGWRLEGDTLRRDFSFRDFSEAFGFMARVALAAEKLDHHPDWSNAYSRVSVALSTHESGGVTELDVRLAEVMQRLMKNGE